MRYPLILFRPIPAPDKLDRHAPRMPIIQSILFFALLVLSTARSGVAGAPPHFAKANPALRPYMGWSSWSSMRENITESGIKAEARVMAERLKAFGYRYVNIDSGWSDRFDRYGRPRTDHKKFPDGMGGMARWLHSKGLKLGIYIVPGMSKAVYGANCRILGTPYTTREIVDKTKPGNTLGSYFYKIDYAKPGAMAYIQSCASLFAKWGVDFIKMDFVGPGDGYKGFRHTNNRPDVEHWAKALRLTGRPIWLELSNGLNLRYAKFWKKYANGWRIDNDIEAYGTPFLTNWRRVKARFFRVAKWARFAGPGGWNDLDSLEIGNGSRDGLTPSERKTTMTLWCISCSPLYLGSDLRHLTARDFQIITNKGAIAIDQAGRPATPISQASPLQVWRAANADGSYTVAFFNLGSVSGHIQIRWRQLGFHGTARVTDIWLNHTIGPFKHGFSALVLPHGCRLLRIVRQSHE